MLDPPLPPRPDNSPTYEPYLVELGQGVFSLHAPEPMFGSSNVGLVIDPDGLTVIDSGPTPAQGRVFRRVLTELTAELELPIRRVVATSSRAPFVGGTTAFPETAVYASDETSEELDTPVAPAALRALLPDLAEAYHDEFRTREATHTITAEAWLSPACQGLVLAGESRANLIVSVPAAGVVFAGALASFGVTPLAFGGDPAAWQRSLVVLADLAPTIVPGHGPPGGRADVDDLSGYFAACRTGRLGDGPWDRWTDRRFDPINIERATRLAAGDHTIPTAMLELLGFG